MSKRPNKNSPGKLASSNSNKDEGTKSEFSFPSPEKKRRRSGLRASAYSEGTEGLEEFEWRMGL